MQLLDLALVGCQFATVVTLRVLEFLYLGSELSDKIVLFATRPSVESLELLSGVEKLFAESFYLFLGAMVYF